VPEAGASDPGESVGVQAADAACGARGLVAPGGSRWSRNGAELIEPGETTSFGSGDVSKTNPVEEFYGRPILVPIDDLVRELIQLVAGLARFVREAHVAVILSHEI
jgi:hypothetical protein